MEKSFVGIFEEDSVAKTLALCVLTLGAYLIYKLYRFSQQINTATNFSISKVFIVTTIVLFTLSLVSLVYGLMNLDDPAILKSSIGLHVISSLFDVTWIIMVRNRMNAIVGANKGDELWLHPMITSIFHVIYMQYKINQGLVKNTT